MESWNHSFKVEAIHGKKFKTRSNAKNHVFEYIDVYHILKRLRLKGALPVSGYAPIKRMPAKVCQQHYKYPVDFLPDYSVRYKNCGMKK